VKFIPFSQRRSRTLASVTVLALAFMFITTQPAHAQTFTTLYSFKGAPDDGNGPTGSLAQDAAGNLYGTTLAGGRFGKNGGDGTVFELDAAGNERPLYVFGSHEGDGILPYAGVVRDAEGNLYGTTLWGGTSVNCAGGGCGTVFKLNPAGMTILHSFTGFPGDGANPVAGVVRDCCGNLYGTAENAAAKNRGAVFRIDKDGNEVLLHSFYGGDGYTPTSLLGVGDGFFYGTTMGGADSAKGNVFEITSTGKITVLFNFTSQSQGEFPFDGHGGQLLRDSAGNLYGYFYEGGAFGAGGVFKLDPSGNETVLHSFTAGADGAGPMGALIMDSLGNLYGTTNGGGDPTCKCGVVFELDTAGNETVLHTFVGSDGAIPEGALLMGAAGTLFGTTTGGGAYGSGTIFKIAQ
jgi:uncharacterized repeat protein (TIGR03803 family)